MENLKENLKQALATLYGELLNNPDMKFDRETETAFVLQWGDNFPTEKHTGILFVGKAVNGWAKKEEQSFEKLFARNDQMKWVENLWNSGGNYATGRSAFWRVIKGIMTKYDKDAKPWYSYAAWSNLYKVSPNNAKGGGNPNKQDKDKQLNLCKQIFKTEIEILSPKFVIMLTSRWETHPGFLYCVNNNQHTKHIEEITWGNNDTIRVYEINGTIFIASVHPQGKKEEIHVKTIVELLKKYQQNV
jgi:hypothetical protein